MKKDGTELQERRDDEKIFTILGLEDKEDEASMKEYLKEDMKVKEEMKVESEGEKNWKRTKK